jgi:hypothetical protein
MAEQGDAGDVAGVDRARLRRGSMRAYNPPMKRTWIGVGFALMLPACSSDASVDPGKTPPGTEAGTETGTDAGPDTSNDKDGASQDALGDVEAPIQYGAEMFVAVDGAPRFAT